MDPVEKASEEARLLPPQVHPHCAGYSQQTAVGGVHPVRDLERERWGDVETITTKLQKRRLEQFGHLARMPDRCMPDRRMPKITLFSWLLRLDHAVVQGGDGETQ